jgi:hypothetical protein
MTFRFVPLDAPSESLRQELLSDLRGFLGGDLDVAVEWVDDIPAEPGGKRPIVKSTLSLPPAP